MSSGKAEPCEVVEKLRLDLSQDGMAPEIGNLLRLKSSRFQDTRAPAPDRPRSGNCGCDGHMPNEKLEGGARVEAGLQVARSHGQFIEVCEQA